MSPNQVPRLPGAVLGCHALEARVREHGAVRLHRVQVVPALRDVGAELGAGRRRRAAVVADQQPAARRQQAQEPAAGGVAGRAVYGAGAWEGVKQREKWHAWCAERGHARADRDPRLTPAAEPCAAVTCAQEGGATQQTAALHLANARAREAGRDARGVRPHRRKSAGLSWMCRMVSRL